MRGPTRAGLHSALVLVALCGCSVGDVDIEGKACPCPEPEYLCDPVSRTCKAGLDCTPRFTVEGFAAAWTTSKNIRWEWEPLGAEEDFGSYTIEIAHTPQELDAGTPMLSFDGAIHPELGLYRLRNTDDREVVKASVSYGVEDGNNTSWHGRLVAVDRYGCPFVTPTAPATTVSDGTLLGERVVFSDVPPDGTLLPPPGDPGGVLEFARSCAGDPCLEIVSNDNATKNLRIYGLVGLDGSAFSAMSDSQFETQAFLEFKIWLEESDPSFWTSIWFEAPVQQPPLPNFRYEPYSPIATPSEPAQSSYWTIQVPLREFVRDGTGEPFSHAQLTDPTTGGITQFSFGTVIPEGERAWLDEIRIRW